MPDAVDQVYAEVQDANLMQLAARLCSAYSRLRPLVLDACEEWTDEQDQAELQMMACLGELRTRTYRRRAADVDDE